MPFCCPCIIPPLPYPHSVPPQDGHTPFHHAAIHNHIGVLNKLTSHSPSHIDIRTCYNHHQDYLGETPLHLACLNGHMESAKLLCDQGANLSAQNGNGNNVLHLAAASGSTAIIDWIIGDMGCMDLLNVPNKVSWPCIDTCLTFFGPPVIPSDHTRTQHTPTHTALWPDHVVNGPAPLLLYYSHSVYVVIADVVFSTQPGNSSFRCHEVQSTVPVLHAHKNMCKRPLERCILYTTIPQCHMYTIASLTSVCLMVVGMCHVSTSTLRACARTTLCNRNSLPY